MTETTKQFYNRNLITVIFMVGTFVTILNQTVLFTALPQIMLDFQISADIAQWLTTFYMLMNGVLIPVTAFLIEKYSTRQLFILAMGLFALGTTIAAISNNFTMLLLARIIQACGAGITIPLMQTVIFTIFPKEKRGTAMGLVGLVISFAPAIGPTFSGFVIDQFSWRYIFLLVLPIAVIVLLIAIVYLKNVTEVNKNQKIDLPSVVLSTLGFGFLLYGVSIAGSNYQSSLSASLWIIAGIIGIVLFIIRELKLEIPMLEFRVFKSRGFSLTTISVVISFIVLMGLQTILPLYIQDIRNMSAFYSGLILLPGAIANGVVSLIAGNIYDKIGGKYLGLIGFLVIAVSSIPFVFLELNTSISIIIIFYTLIMLGIGIIMMPMTTEGLNSLRDNLIYHGTAVNNTFRQVGGSIGTALLITIYTNVSNNTIESGITEINAQIHGMSYAFIGIAIFACIGIIISFFLKS
ncbi:MAG: multidrug efflux MFS transporter, partial [Candidatus Methanofastidiosa archaeon]|nr:multidrug efflux MFS transporter [Candidatus Methanofastidiosa archaeon]